MRLLIASDLHGSLAYAKKLIEIYQNGSYDYLVLLGDILYHGPRNPLPLEYNPKEVALLLNQYKDEILCVQGNCDSEVDQMVLDFKIEPKIHMLIDQYDCYLEHGHHLSSYKKGSIVLHGHTHIVRQEEIDGVTYLNPGSITLPKDGKRMVIIYDKGFSFYNIEEFK